MILIGIAKVKGWVPEAVALQDSPLPPNVRAKLATTAGRQGPVGENVQRTADRALVACRWRSA